MSIDNLSALRRGVAYAAASAMFALVLGACNDSTSSDGTRDRIAPRVTLTAATGRPDTVIAFTTTASDNLGLKTVRVQAIGAVGLAYDTTFTSAVTNFQLPFTLFSSRAVPAGTPVIITATAIDGAGNTSGVDTLLMATGNVPPPEVRIISPTSGSSAVLGKSILVTVSGKTALKVLSLGLSTTGPVVYTDSVLFSSPLRDSITMQDTINIPINATPGTMTVTPFLRDSLGQRAVGPSITITIQTAAQINSVPVVNQYCVGNQAYNNSCGHGLRVEVGDTLHVEADDPSGISTLGYEVRRTIGGAIDDSDTFTSNGQLTFLPHTFSMRLPYTTFPTTAYIQVFAVNSNGVRAYAKLASGADRIDTVTVVAGVTRFLPFGGEVADALYHPGKDRLYLTNITRNQVEVFNLGDSSFKTPVIVGSRPWGLAGWPRDRNGTMGDTVLVANSGGTNISYVDLNAGVSGSGLEVSRYDLPNIIAFTITTTTSATSGLPIQVRTKYDFSDRPQYLGCHLRRSSRRVHRCSARILDDPHRWPVDAVRGAQWHAPVGESHPAHFTLLFRAGDRTVKRPGRYARAGQIRRGRNELHGSAPLQGSGESALHCRHDQQARLPRHDVRPRLRQFPAGRVRRRRQCVRKPRLDVRCIERR